MVLQVETLKGCSNPSFFAVGPKERPTSITSGACGPLLPLLALIASTSSPEPASGLSSFTFSPYLALNPSITAPYPHQSRGSAITVSSPSLLAPATSSSIDWPKAAPESPAAATTASGRTRNQVGFISLSPSFQVNSPTAAT